MGNNTRQINETYMLKNALQVIGKKNKFKQYCYKTLPKLYIRAWN